MLPKRRHYSNLSLDKQREAIRLTMDELRKAHNNTISKMLSENSVICIQTTSLYIGIKF